MGSLSDFSLHIRAFLMSYKWRRIDPVPFSPLKKPLKEARIAIVSSAGFVLNSQELFDAHIESGDDSFREIPSNTEVADIVDSHRSKCFDHAGMREDPNVAFPLDRIRELATDGVIGSIADNHLSFMGSVTAPLRLIRKVAPVAAEKLLDDNVDAALLVPV